MATIAWNQEQISNLIEEFHSRRVLWDITYCEYKNRDKKRDALKEIARVFDVSSDEIDKKLKVLKIQFRREHKQLCDKKKSGSSPKKAGWFGYESLMFLLNQTESRGSRSTIPEESTDQEERDIQADEALTQLDDESYALPPSPGNQPNSNTTSVTRPTPVCPTTSTFRIPPPKDIKRKRQEQADEAFKIMQDIKGNASKRDEFTVFGELVASKLRKCLSSPRSVAIAQRSIHDILFNLEMEQIELDFSSKSSETADKFAVNTFGGQFTNQRYNQYYSPSNTSESLSPSILTENAHNFHQPSTTGSCFPSLPSSPSSPLNPANNVLE